jgi:hypothetical protein
MEQRRVIIIMYECGEGRAGNVDDGVEPVLHSSIRLNTVRFLYFLNASTIHDSVANSALQLDRIRQKFMPESRSPLHREHW